MRRSLNLARLHELCGRPLAEQGDIGRVWNAVEELGSIAQLWLIPEVLLRAAAARRQMHGDHASLSDGSVTPCTSMLADEQTGFRLEPCQIGVLLATEKDAADALPLLRPAFLLPVEWRREASSSPRLPQRLAEFAAQVLQDLRIDETLSLHLPQSFEDADDDLSGLMFSYDSAWAALAAAAIVTAEGGATRPEVLVSAAWTRLQPGRGLIAGVDRIEEKLDAAVATGAQIIFLPQENMAAADHWRRCRPHAAIKIEPLFNQPNAPRRAIAPLLHALEATPTTASGASFAARRDYFVRMAEENVNDYYRDELLAEVVQRMQGENPGDRLYHGVERLVIIASKSWSLGLLLTSLLNPRQVLVLHDGKLPAALSRLQEMLPTIGSLTGTDRVVTAVQCGPGNSLADDVRAALGGFLGGSGSGPSVIDLTAGYRDFHFTVLGAVPRDADVVFVNSEQHKEYARPIPGTERLQRLTLPQR